MWLLRHNLPEDDREGARRSDAWVLVFPFLALVVGWILMSHGALHAL